MSLDLDFTYLGKYKLMFSIFQFSPFVRDAGYDRILITIDKPLLYIYAKVLIIIIKR